MNETIIVLFENLGNEKPWSEKWQARTLTERRFMLPTHSGVTIGDVKLNVSRSSPIGSTGFMMAFADLDGDKRTDIVTEAAEVLFWLKQPEKLSDKWQPVYIGHIFPDRATGLNLADVNGDGRVDLFVGGYSHTPRHVDTQTLVRARTPCGRLAWFEQPTFSMQPWKRHDVSRRAQGMYDMFFAHDVNRDGLLDFFATRGTADRATASSGWNKSARPPLFRPSAAPGRKKIKVGSSPSLSTIESATAYSPFLPHHSVEATDLLSGLPSSRS